MRNPLSVPNGTPEDALTRPSYGRGGPPWPPCLRGRRASRPSRALRDRRGSEGRHRGLPLQGVSRVVVFLLLALALTLPATAQKATDWPMFRGDHQQQGRAEGTLATDLKVLWTFSIEDGVEATAAIAGGTVYVGSLGGFLYALDLQTGKERWRYEATAEIKSSPAVSRGVVYFGDGGGVLHAVDAATGKKRWTHEVGAEITSSPNIVSVSGDAGGDCVLFGSYDQSLYCLAPKDGTVRWQVETSGPVHGTPAVFESSAISAGCDGFLRRVEVKSGKTLSEAELGGYVAASAAVAGGIAYVPTFESEVLAVDLKTGKILWRYKPDREFPFYASAAVAADRIVTAGRDKRVHAIDRKTGAALWMYATRARIDSSPVIVGDRVFFGGGDGRLTALRLKDGKVAWQFEAGGAMLAYPAVADGRLIISTEDGIVYCFGATS